MKFEEAMTVMRAGGRVRPVGAEGWVTIIGDAFSTDTAEDIAIDGPAAIDWEWEEVER